VNDGGLQEGHLEMGEGNSECEGIQPLWNPGFKNDFK